jgi:hypothetical protein
VTEIIWQAPDGLAHLTVMLPGGVPGNARGQCGTCREVHDIGYAVSLKQAGVLGWQDGRDCRPGTTRFGDLDAGGKAQLMTALGETGPTTEGNHPRRLALLQAYRDAYTQAKEG